MDYFQYISAMSKPPTKKRKLVDLEEELVNWLNCYSFFDEHLKKLVASLGIYL